MEEDKKPESSDSGAESTPAEPVSLEQSDNNTVLAVPGSDGGSGSGSTPGGEPPKKSKGLKHAFHKINIYLLLFIFILVIAGVVAAVSYLNSKKPPPTPNIASKNLTAQELQQLGSSDATIGDSGQTLTVQGNAIFSGQALVRGDLDVAGAISLGGDLQAQNFTASGKVNLSDTQAKSLQVANDATFKGSVTIQQNLNVAGASSFNGPITVGQITVSNLVISGNGELSVPNHIAFSGPSPARSSINQGILGGGGASVGGSDTSGTINVNTGGNPSGNGCFISMTFSRPFAGTPRVLVTPIGQGAGMFEYYVNRSATGFSLCSDNTLPKNQSFAFDYFIAD